MNDQICRVQEITLGRTVRALRIENDWLATTVLLDKGADIYELIYKPKALDVLWKSPWGLKEPGRDPSGHAPNSEEAWLEYYAGGWQELFPNGGDACVYKGVELCFHGEASMLAWDYEVTQDDAQAVEVRLYARLRRSPFTIERWMRVEAGQPVLSLRGRVTNYGGETMDYMWSHHPAFGAPFLSGACRIDTGAKTLVVDDAYAGTHNPLTLGARSSWPQAPSGTGLLDLSRVPAENQRRDILAYFTDYESGWYALTNPELGVGVGLVWPKETLPYAWFWQEMNASPGFPFYQNCYVMAIEPATSIPGQGLVTVMHKTSAHRTLAPGESAEMTLKAVFYESTVGVANLSAEAQVTLKA